MELADTSSSARARDAAHRLAGLETHFTSFGSRLAALEAAVSSSGVAREKAVQELHAARTTLDQATAQASSMVSSQLRETTRRDSMTDALPELDVPEHWVTSLLCLSNG